MNTIEHKQCYMYTNMSDLNCLEDVREDLSYWCNTNVDKVIVSHSVALIGTQYLLSIVYYYID